MPWPTPRRPAAAVHRASVGPYAPGSEGETASTPSFRTKRLDVGDRPSRGTPRRKPESETSYRPASGATGVNLHDAASVPDERAGAKLVPSLPTAGRSNSRHTDRRNPPGAGGISTKPWSVHTQPQLCLMAVLNAPTIMPESFTSQAFAVVTSAGTGPLDRGPRGPSQRDAGVVVGRTRPAMPHHLPGVAQCLRREQLREFGHPHGNAAATDAVDWYWHCAPAVPITTDAPTALKTQIIRRLRDMPKSLPPATGRSNPESRFGGESPDTRRHPYSRRWICERAPLSARSRMNRSARAPDDSRPRPQRRGSRPGP